MGDSVARILERQLVELEDLKALKIFNEAELRDIVNKRRDFEYLLQRRAPRKVDYIRYVAYEIEIEELRRERKAALGIRKTSVSDHGCDKRVTFIFERLVRRFAGDKDAWRQYIQYCTIHGSEKTLATVYPKLLRLHPHDVEFWIRAVMHELKVVGSMDGARVLMQRALRMNPKSADLWLAYLRLELKCLGRVRYVRDELGITTPAPPSILDADEGEEAAATPAAEPTAEEAERKAAEATFLDGGVARIVFNHAMAALPTQIKLELQFADACAGATDPVTRLPLVPKLLAVIIEDMKSRFPQEPAMWAWLAEHASLHVVPVVAPAKSSKKRRSSSAASESISAPAVAVFEQGLVALAGDVAKQQSLMHAYLAFLCKQCSSSSEWSDAAIAVCARLSPTVEVASTHCSLLAGTGRSAACPAVAEACLKAFPTSVQAWLLLADTTFAAGVDSGSVQPAAAAQACVTILERGIRACAPSLAMGDASNKAEFELLWRRKIDLRLVTGVGGPLAIQSDLKAATALGMLLPEQALWSCLDK